MELDDSSATVRSLGILANDCLDLREETEDENKLHSAAYERSRQREEGNGFGGTLLGGNAPSRELSAMQIGADVRALDDAAGKDCSACTYRNLRTAETCEMCQRSLK